MLNYLFMSAFYMSNRTVPHKVIAPNIAKVRTFQSFKFFMTLISRTLASLEAVCILPLLTLTVYIVNGIVNISDNKEQQQTDAE